jgi:Leucine-rich repeat (LRR) protein
VKNIAICPALPSCWSFHIIDFSFNKIKGHIPLIGAHYLDYSNNEFSEIPSSYAVYLNGMKYLMFSANSLSGEISSSICEAPHLQFIDLSRNNLSGSIPSCILGSQSLQFLNLATNKLHEIIPDNLTILNLENNRIIDTFPFWLGEIPNLQVFVINSNHFYGTLDHLPNFETNFQKLRILDLASNNFYGSLPLLWFENLQIHN